MLVGLIFDVESISGVHLHHGSLWEPVLQYCYAPQCRYTIAIAIHLKPASNTNPTPHTFSLMHMKEVCILIFDHWTIGGAAG